MTETTSGPAPQTINRTSVSAAVEELCMALAFLGLALVLFFGALTLDGGAGYQAVGPAVFPFLVSGLGLLCGVGLTASKAKGLMDALRLSHSTGDETPVIHDDSHHGPAGSDRPRRRRWLNFFGLAAVLGAYAALLIPVGFWQVTGVVFACAARIFGSKRWIRNLIVGYGAGLLVYFLFDRLLGVGLPDGYIRIAEW